MADPRIADTDLILRHIDGQLTDDEFAALNARLGEDAAFRGRFIQMALQAGHVAAAASNTRPAKPSSPVAEPVASAIVTGAAPGWRIDTRLAIAAAVLVAGIAIAVIVSLVSEAPVEPERPVVATLIDAQGVHWNSEPIRMGSPVRAGEFELASGRVELQTLSGVTIAIDGPAHLRWKTSQSAALSYGSLTARVPENAVGFNIATPGVGVVDLGTEFGVAVDDSGTTEVRVYDGAVRLDFQTGESRIVRAGSGWAIARDGRASAIDTSAARVVFVEDREIAAERWLRFANELGKDPGLVAHYRFDDTLTSGELVNSKDPTGPLVGRITGASIEPGRHFGKSALRFHGDGSEDRVVIGESSSPGTPLVEQAWGDTFKGAFTVAVWFKVNEFDKAFNTLAVQEGRNWRLVRNQLKPTLTFNTGHPEPNHALTGNTPIDDGRWHLAVITQEPVPGSGVTKRLYIDGKLEAKHTTWWRPKPNGRPIYVGFNDAVPQLGGNVFNGWIDELIVFRKAITPERIEELYEHGKPLEEHSQGKETEQ